MTTISSLSAGGQPRRRVFRNILCNDRGLRAGWRFLMYVGLFLALFYSLGTALDHFVESEAGLFAAGLFGAAGFVCAIGTAQIMSRIEKRPELSAYGLPARGAFGKSFWQGWLAGLIEVSVVVGLLAALHGYSFGRLAERGVMVLLYGVSWAVVSVLASLLEEFAFRGYAQHTLAEGIGFWSAAEVLSAIFALAHLYDPVKGWTGAFVLFALGLFWCFTLRRTGNLWFAVGMHASFNFGDTFLFSAPNVGSGSPVEGHLSSGMLHGPAWVTGGAMGPEASVFRFLTIGILFLLINKLYPSNAENAQANNRVEVSTTLEAAAQPKKDSIRSQRWRLLVFVCLVLALVLVFGLKQYHNPHPASKASDFESWQARPKLDPVALQTPERRIDPCLFIVPPGASNQPVASGSVGECLMLVPDGTELNLYEVFLWSGSLVPIKTDLYVMDFMPLAFTRIHVVDSLARREHKYFRDVYDPHFYWDTQPYRFVQWFLPDGISIKYERSSSGPADEHPIWSQVHYDTNVPLPLFKGSRVNWTSSTWDLSLQHGTTYLLDSERGSLVGIFDRDGNEIHLARKPNGDLAEITSPNGNWIRISQENGLINSAADSTGNSVNYTYDERHRLKRVTNFREETNEYEYNLFNHIDRIVDSKGSSVLEIGYAPHDRENKVVQLSLPDGSKFQIDYFLDIETGVGHVDITDPKKNTTRVTMNPRPGENDSFYTVEKLAGEQDRSRLRAAGE